jgi:seryl-tRNA synthetase
MIATRSLHFCSLTALRSGRVSARKLSVGTQAAATTTARVSARVSARDTPLELQLCSSQPQLILSHLQSRGDDSNLHENVLKLAELRVQRNSHVVESNEAKHKKRVLSAQIGKLMAQQTSGQEAGAEAGAEGGDGGEAGSRCRDLKAEVEGINEFIHETDQTIENINTEIKQNFMLLPNLLHDRLAYV